MGTDKQILIDLTQLTPETTNQLVKIQEDIIKDLGKSGKRKTSSKTKQQLSNIFQEPDDKTQKRLAKLQKDLELETLGKSKGGITKKIFGDKQVFGNLLNIGNNHLGFIQGNVTKLIPFIGTALLVTGVIAAFVKRVDDFQKKFIDNVDGRIDVFRSKQDQALIQSGLQQLIITSSSGSAEPRDSYNTFNEINGNQGRIEADFRIRDTTGVD